jgi:hypothetical protein
MEKRKELLASRMRAVYLQGNLFNLRFMLQSSSFGDYLNWLELIRLLVQADHQVLANGYGFLIVLYHGNGFSTLYGEKRGYGEKARRDRYRGE